LPGHAIWQSAHPETNRQLSDRLKINENQFLFDVIADPLERAKSA